MPLKRRTLISWGIGGFAAATGRHYLRPSLDRLSATELPPTASLPDVEPLFRFTALGDVGTGEGGQYEVAQAIAQHHQRSPFALALMAGDNIYPDGEIERISDVFEQPYAPLLQNGVKFRASLGNHDFRTNQGTAQVAYPGYNMDGKYYTFTEQSVQFFALDTNQKYHQGIRFTESDWTRQLRWLRTELSQSSAQWKVVFAHHPIYSSGSHGSDESLARALTPLFADYGVQIYINGHDHNYERTKLINGTTYITTGNGAKLRSVEPSRYTAHATSQLGFTAFDVYPDRIVVKAIDTSNTTYDEAHIVHAESTVQA
ncbi:MAG: metallophosphoesterase [Cyanobacteria bacterium J06560_2]